MSKAEQLLRRWGEVRSRLIVPMFGILPIPVLNPVAQQELSRVENEIMDWLAETWPRKFKDLKAKDELDE